MNEGMKNIMEIEKIKKEADELMMKKIDHYEKEIALVREQAQIDIMTLEKRVAELLKINESHQKLNGELREDNKKLAKQVDDNINKVITDAWYKWQKKTGHQSLPGTHIHGNVCVIQKVQDDAA